MLIGIDLFGMQHPEFRGRGIGRYVTNLVEALHRHDRTNDYVLFGHKGYPRDPFSWETAGRDGAWRIETVASSEDALGPDNGLDLALITLPFSDFALPRNMRRGPKLASLVYDFIPFLFPERYLADPSRAGHYHDSLRSVRRYDALLAISEATRRDGEAILGLPPGRVSTIGCGGRPDFFKPRADHNSDREGKRVLRSRHHRAVHLQCGRLRPPQERGRARPGLSALAAKPEANPSIGHHLWLRPAMGSACAERRW